MIHTQHMMTRMQQRSLPQETIDIILNFGEWNERGDRLTLSRRELDDLLQQKRRELKELGREVKEIERLHRRRGGTVVLDGEVLITAYDKSKRNRA